MSNDLASVSKMYTSLLNEIKSKSEHIRINETEGIINHKTGASVLIKQNGTTNVAASLLSQSKNTADGKSIHESIESNDYSVRRNIMTDEIVVNKHKLNPDIYELSDMRNINNDETTAVGNLTFSATVLVKAYDQTLKKWVLIRRPIRLPLFSPLLNLPNAPEKMGLNTDIKQEVLDFTGRSEL